MTDGVVHSTNVQIATDLIETGVAAGQHVQRVKAGFGGDGSYAEVAFPTVAVAAGHYSKLSAIRARGRNPDVDAAAAETIWGAGGAFVAPTEARVHTVVSSEVSDTASGAGAREITIAGLDADLIALAETIETDGTSNVSTQGAYSIILDTYVNAAGSTGYNAGNITVTASGDATTSSKILAAQGEAFAALYVVPAGHTGYLVGFYGTINRTTGAAGADLLLYSKDFDPDNATPSRRLIDCRGIQASGTSSLYHEFRLPIVLPEKTLVWLDVETTANDTDISGGIEILVMEA